MVGAQWPATLQAVGQNDDGHNLATGADGPTV
jgi:hypothetical protein